MSLLAAAGRTMSLTRLAATGRTLPVTRSFSQAAVAESVNSAASPAQRVSPESQGRVVVISSGKGGVGKTTCAASFSYGLAKRGFKTVVVDFDIGLRNLGAFFRRKTPPRLLALPWELPTRLPTVR